MNNVIHSDDEVVLEQSFARNTQPVIQVSSIFTGFRVTVTKFHIRTANTALGWVIVVINFETKDQNLSGFGSRALEICCRIPN